MFNLKLIDSIYVIISLVDKIKVFLSELKTIFKQITWPERKDLIRLTGVVIFISALMGIVLGGVDLGLTKLVGILTLLKK